MSGLGRLTGFFLFLVLCLFCVAAEAQQDNVTGSPTIIKIDLTYTTIDVPGAGANGVYGINSAGDMAGYYGVTDAAPHKRGFLYRDGVFTAIVYPGAWSTFANGINDSGLIVGAALIKGGSAAIGFTYDGISYKPLRDGNAVATYAFGLNNLGTIVGGVGNLYTTDPFRLSNGKYRILNVPVDDVYVLAGGINAAGTIVGQTDYDGFICRSTCKLLDAPGARETSAYGVNDSEITVGWYGDDSCLACGFAYKNGQYLSFSYPGATGTAGFSINSAGQIVGQYTFDFKTYHGFISSPITDADFR